MQLTPDQDLTLHQLLSAELQCAKDFKSILDQEFNALKGDNAALIEQISQQKQQRVIQMQQHQQARDRMLRQLGAAHGTAGIEQLLQQTAHSRAIAVWKELVFLAAQLREQNEINGGIIFLNQRHTKQALEILSGKPQEKNTYGRKGQQMPGVSHHTLAKA